MFAPQDAEDDPLDPYAEHFRREPLAGAAVAVLLRAGPDPSVTEKVAASLERLIRGRGRGFELAVLPAGTDAAGAVRQGLAETTAPLVLVTQAREPWTAAHLEPLLKEINTCDHISGRRSVGTRRGVARWLGTAVWRWVFAVPVLDVHSPCRLHRRAPLDRLPLQSGSDFLDVEIFAKATFLGQLLHEVGVPPLDAPGARVAWSDVAALFKRPVFVAPSGPSEDLEGDHEADDRPDNEDPHRGEHLHDAGPLQDHGPEGADELRQGERLDERLDGVGEPLGREKDA